MTEVAPQTSAGIPVRKLARITGRPGGAGELREALTHLEMGTRQEPGCIEFSFFQSITDEDEFVLLEEFTDQAAFQKHLELPHTRAFFAAGLVAGVHALDVPFLR